MAVAVLCVVLAGCAPASPPDSQDVVVFVLDSPVNEGFVEGRVVGLTNADVTHGSLVARVLRSYCAARAVSVSVEDPGGQVSRSAYLAGLREVRRYVAADPSARVVVNVSLSSDEADAEEAALVDELTRAGVLIVAAAGNDDGDRPAYPAAYPGVIAVASATPSGKALNSNYGPHVAVAASGDISFIDYEFLPFERLYREMQARGTSFAAPRVAAAIAFALTTEPGLSPAAAWERVRASAVPIADDYYRRGLLGAGYLDVERTKALISPRYELLHHVLPLCVLAVLGVLSLYLWIRHGLVGVFAVLVLWLAGVPLGLLAAVELTGLVGFLGAGSAGVGLAATGILALGFALALLILGGQALKAAAGMLAPFVLFLLLGLVRPSPAWRVAAAGGASLLGVAAAAGLQRHARRVLRHIGDLAERRPQDAAERLGALCRRSVDGRIKRAAVEAMGRVADEAAVAFLLREAWPNGPAVRALAQAAGRNPDAFRPWLRRFRSLAWTQRRRLLSALWRAREPALLPHLSEAAGADPSGRLARLAQALEAAEAERQDS
jgi:hypothetical protein